MAREKLLVISLVAVLALLFGIGFPDRPANAQFAPSIKVGAECIYNSDCTSGGYCRRDGRCFDACLQDIDCRDGEICVNGPSVGQQRPLKTCKRAPVSPAACVSDRDCVTGRCLANKCAPRA